MIVTWLFIRVIQDNLVQQEFLVLKVIKGREVNKEKLVRMVYKGNEDYLVTKETEVIGDPLVYLYVIHSDYPIHINNIIFSV